MNEKIIIIDLCSEKFGISVVTDEEGAEAKNTLEEAGAERMYVNLRLDSADVGGLKNRTILGS